MNTKIDYAIEAKAAGFAVFPCCWPTPDGKCGCGRGHTGRDIGKVPLTDHGLKDATITLLGINEHWKRWPQANIGAAVPADGIVIDVDKAHNGFESLAKLEAIHGELNSTRRHATGGGGYHIFYKLPPGVKVKNTTGVLGEGIDTKTGGGYIIWAGSRHISGQYYEVLEDIPVADLPEWTLKALEEVKPAARTVGGDDAPIPEGQRNSHLASLAGSMRRRNMSAEAILAGLLEENNRCNPPLPAVEVQRIAESVGRYEPAPAPGSPDEPIHLTDMGNSTRLALKYQSILRYCWGAEKWLIWTGGKWDADDGQRIMELARQTAKGIYNEAAAAGGRDESESIAKWAHTSESEARLAAMLTLGRSENGIPVRPDELDRDKWLLNCKNGTINLKTGELQKHNPLDLITKQVPVNYNPAAECPNWLKFLDTVTAGDTSAQEYLQKAVGYSLTGDTSAQVIFLLYGLGQNGKSTFTDTIRLMLADYSVRLQAEDLMIADHGQRGQAHEGVADLQGARLALGSELQDGRQLNTSLIKDISGQDSIRARRLYAHEVEFKPECKIWLFGNHKPVIKDTTLSIWRRVKLIPFTATIPDADRIDGFAEKLLYPEWPGILAWAVRGCLLWQDAGLKDVDAIKTATAAYRAAEDILGDFLTDCCILEHGTTIPKAELKALYLKWCEDNRADAITQKSFKSRLEEKGITDGVSSDGKARIWRGIRARTTTDKTDITDKTDKTLRLSDKTPPIFPKLSMDISTRIESYGKNPSVLSVLSVDSDGTLPDCPTCGKNNWIAEPPKDGCLLWRCGGCGKVYQGATDES